MLFIIKKFYCYNGERQVSNGLRSSALFVVELLQSLGVKAHLAEAIDGNSVDALIDKCRPERVVLEALWVTPDKLAELRRLWPTVRFTVRVHSETPFLANEGQAMSWIAAYMAQGVEVGFNSGRTADDFLVMGKTAYLPNYYPKNAPVKHRPRHGRIDVGCFGAIRPLKNQLIQAVAAIKFARSRGHRLVFHMNGSRLEQAGGNVLKNIQSLMATEGATLELHPWLDHEDFLELVGSMDICLQVSLSESFNIVSADAVSMGVPLVGSPAIAWLPKISQARVDSAASIEEAMERAGDDTVRANLAALAAHNMASKEAWRDWLKRH